MMQVALAAAALEQGQKKNDEARINKVCMAIALLPVHRATNAALPQMPRDSKCNAAKQIQAPSLSCVAGSD
jgi:hypothetical protein